MNQEYAKDCEFRYVIFNEGVPVEYVNKLTRESYKTIYKSYIRKEHFHCFTMKTIVDDMVVKTTILFCKDPNYGYYAYSMAKELEKIWEGDASNLYCIGQFFNKTN